MKKAKKRWPGGQPCRQVDHLLWGPRPEKDKKAGVRPEAGDGHIRNDACFVISKQRTTRGTECWSFPKLNTMTGNEALAGAVKSFKRKNQASPQCKGVYKDSKTVSDHVNRGRKNQTCGDKLGTEDMKCAALSPARTDAEGRSCYTRLMTRRIERRPEKNDYKVTLSSSLQGDS